MPPSISNAEPRAEFIALPFKSLPNVKARFQSGSLARSPCLMSPMPVLSSSPVATVNSKLSARGPCAPVQARIIQISERRSEEHTSELQSLMRISYAVFCLKKKNENIHHLIETSKTRRTLTQ